MADTLIEWTDATWNQPGGGLHRHIAGVHQIALRYVWQLGSTLRAQRNIAGLRAQAAPAPSGPAGRELTKPH